MDGRFNPGYYINHYSLLDFPRYLIVSGNRQIGLCNINQKSYVFEYIFSSHVSHTSFANKWLRKLAEAGKKMAQIKRCRGGLGIRTQLLPILVISSLAEPFVSILVKRRRNCID